jgi:hypothetical protein
MGLVAILLAIVCYVPHDPCLHDTVDRIELNHVYSPTTGQRIGDYVLFWDWNGDDWEIVDWRDVTLTGRWTGCGTYQVMWRDNGGSLRIVTTRQVLETWTLYDREVANRKLLPCRDRRRLCHSKN